MFLLVLLSAAAGAAQASDAPTAQTEMLAFSVPDEFDVGYQARNDATQVVELVEPPETVANWSKLVTSLMFFNAADRGLGSFYSQWRDQMRGSWSAVSSFSLAVTSRWASRASESDIASTLGSEAEDASSAARSRRPGKRTRTLQADPSSATRTTTLPVFSPVNMALRACGAASSPS